jgi:hypothetical protein
MEMELDLQRGSVFVDTKKMTADSRVEVTIPVGRVQIGEGECQVTSDGIVGGWGKPMRLILAGSDKVIEIPGGFMLGAGMDEPVKLPRPGHNIHIQPRLPPSAEFPRADFSNTGVTRRVF